LRKYIFNFSGLHLMCGTQRRCGVVYEQHFYFPFCSLKKLPDWQTNVEQIRRRRLPTQSKIKCKCNHGMRQCFGN